MGAFNFELSAEQSEEYSQLADAFFERKHDYEKIYHEYKHDMRKCKLMKFQCAYDGEGKTIGLLSNILFCIIREDDGTTEYFTEYDHEKIVKYLLITYVEKNKNWDEVKKEFMDDWFSFQNLYLNALDYLRSTM